MLKLRANGDFMNMEATMDCERNSQVWLRVAAKLQELSEELTPTGEMLQGSKNLRQNYKMRLLALKEQAIRNSLQG